jgi:uncharacterized protein YegP (UPF0339 family)
MKNKSIIPAVLFCLMSTTTFAQLAMGKWRTHLAYNNVTQIAQSESKIYAVSDGALFSVDKVDKQFEFYSKVSGLNGSNISRIEFDQANKQLLIAYANGNIDLIGSGGVVNIPDLYNKQMSASKAINQVKFNDNKAYLSCDFGIVVLNMLRKEVLDTYYIGAGGSEVKVWNTTILNDTIYALTSTGGTSTTPYSYTLYKASVSNKQLVNFANWKTVANLPGTGDLQSIATFSNKLYILRGGKLWSKEGQNWSPFHNEYTLQNFNVTNGSMNLYAGTNFYLVNEALTLTDLSNKGNITDAEYDLANKTYWFAGNDLGILSYTEAGVLTPYKPASPTLNSPWDMTFSNKRLFVVPGGRMAAQDNRSGVVMLYEDGVWTNIAPTGRRVVDFMNVAVDPSNPKHYFVTSFGTGLYEFNNDLLINLYDLNNSPITSVIAGNLDYMRLDGAIFDKQGNLFFTNSYASSAVRVLLKNGNWSDLVYPGLVQKETLGKILISNLNPNQKWVISVRGGELGVLDDNGTITDKSDDKTRTFMPYSYLETDANQHQVSVDAFPGLVQAIAQDKNGVIWVGTNEGPYLFSNPSKAFEADYKCSRVKIPRKDGTNAADYLLKDEEIKAIAIDGANRKWIGTKTSGAYLLTEKGDSTIQHFTITNSPLLSNTILSIAVNPVTGEVFIGTDKGLVSYQSDANEAGVSFGEVYAYPNPVRQGFTGLITITGLIENTQVKITDLSGNLICQTISNGSLATWDGKDVHGRKVSTGIYLALCSSPDGTQSTITKIMVIN